MNADGTKNLEHTFDFADEDVSSYIDSDRSSSLEFIENKNFISKGTLHENIAYDKA